MTGTIINIATILIGSILGLFFGSRLPERVRETVMAGLGVFTGAIGIQMFLQTENAIIVLGSILVGGILGEWLQIEAHLSQVGSLLEKQFSKRTKGESRDDTSDEQTDSRARFIQGFLTASLLFCVGPMTILGSIQDGLTGDYQLLAIKSVLDGFASLAFASTLGIGVIFSTLTVLFFQGGISLLAVQAQAVITPAMMNEMTAAGGILLVGLAISSLLEIKPIRAGNFLPALALAPLLVWILSLLGLG
jgi:hypothetical protein